MSDRRILNTLVAALVLVSCAAAPAWADRDDRDRSKFDKQEKRERAPQQAPVLRRDDRDRDRSPRVFQRTDGDRTRVTRPPRDYVFDKRYDHNRYYPPTGYRTRVLPRDRYVYTHRNKRYYYHSGIWYLYSGAYFVVTLPPIGVIVPVLPPYYTTIWVGGVPYYYANGVYYVWHPVQRVYVVTDPPPPTAVSEEPTEPQKLFVYPKQGQSAEQQAKDRYQCHQWAKEQTGFDPTRAGGNVSVEQYVSKRAEYLRAEKACLEARGYSVQ